MTPQILSYVFGFILSLVAISGGVFALIRERDIVDEQGNVTEVEISGLGKFKSNYPSIGAIALGLLLGYFVSDGLHDIEMKVPLDAGLSIVGALDGKPVFVAAIPTEYHASSNSMSPENVSNVRIHVEHPDNYSVIAYTVRGVRRSGETVYSVAHGPALFSDNGSNLRFDGTLYVDSVEEDQ